MGVFTIDRGVEPYLVEGVQLSPFVPSLCIAEPLTGVLRPRNYAMLLFGREPQRFVPGAFSIYSAYPGRDRSDPVARRFEIAGTLLDQARRLQELLDAEAVTLFDKTNRTAPNAEKYPRRALQEAMMNAIAHRDYELPDPSRLTSFSDRIEMVSPGALPYGLTLHDLRAGQVTPRWRNQSLAWFLSRLQLAQAEGQGIPTIRRMMKEAGCPPPVFDATEVSVSCTLRAHPRFRTLKVPAPAAGKGRTRIAKTSAKPRTGQKKTAGRKKASSAKTSTTKTSRSSRGRSRRG
jgi:ATP-dependent DNA helicase RecG